MLMALRTPPLTVTPPVESPKAVSFCARKAPSLMVTAPVYEPAPWILRRLLPYLTMPPWGNVKVVGVMLTAVKNQPNRNGLLLGLPPSLMTNSTQPVELV